MKKVLSLRDSNSYKKTGKLNGKEKRPIVRHSQRHMHYPNGFWSFGMSGMDELFYGILAIAIASIHHLLPITLPAQFGPQTFLALAFFMTGYLYRKVGLYQNKHQSRLFLLWLLVPAIASLYVHDLSMSSAGSLSWLYYILALAGTIGFLQLAKLLQYDKVAVVFDYIGDKTLYILTFHFLSFKLVSYAWIIYRNLPLSNLAQFPVLEETNSWMWIIYSITGVAVPLLIWELFHLPIGKIIK